MYGSLSYLSGSLIRFYNTRSVPSCMKEGGSVPSGSNEWKDQIILINQISSGDVQGKKDQL